MKTKDELNAIKAEVEALNAKLGQLTDKELEQVTAGMKIVVIKTSQESSNTSDKNGFVPLPY